MFKVGCICIFVVGFVFSPVAKAFTGASTYVVSQKMAGDIVDDLGRDYFQNIQKKFTELHVSFLKLDVPAKSPSERRFVSPGREGCHGGSGTTLEQVASIKRHTTVLKGGIKEEISVFGCSKDIVLFKEIIVIRGKNIKPLSNDEVYKGKRRWSLAENESYRSYQVSTRFFSGSAHSVITKRMGKVTETEFSTYDQKVISISERPLSSGVTEAKIESEKFNINISFKYFGDIKVHSRGGFYLKAVTDRRGHRTFYSADQDYPLSPRQFKESLDSNIRSNITHTFVKPLLGYLGYMPNTDSKTVNTTTTRFRKEFDDILNLTLSRDKLVGADFQRLKDFLYRTLSAMDGGELVFKDSRPIN